MQIGMTVSGTFNMCKEVISMSTGSTAPYFHTSVLLLPPLLEEPDLEQLPKLLRPITFRYTPCWLYQILLLIVL